MNLGMGMEDLFLFAWSYKWYALPLIPLIFVGFLALQWEWLGEPDRQHTH